MRNTQYFHHLFSTSFSLWFLSKFFFFCVYPALLFSYLSPPSTHLVCLIRGWQLFFGLLVPFPVCTFVKIYAFFFFFIFFFLEDNVYLTVPCVAFSLFFIPGAKEWIFLKEGRWKEELGWDERAWNERGRCQLKQWTPLHPPLDRWGEWSWQPSH